MSKRKQVAKSTKDLTLFDFLIREKAGKVEIINPSGLKDNKDVHQNEETMLSCRFRGSKERGWALALATSYVILAGYKMIHVLTGSEVVKGDGFFVEEGLVIGAGDEPDNHIFIKVVVDPNTAYFRLGFSLDVD